MFRTDGLKKKESGKLVLAGIRTHCFPTTTQDPKYHYGQ